MCDLTKKFKGLSYTGYKVVCKDINTGNYFSAAMGFQYKCGRVPIPEKQCRIGYRFNEFILIDSTQGYREKMIGRTTVFVNQEDATKLAEDINRNLSEKEQKHLETIVIKMTISEGLMEGIYGLEQVVAGKRILFMKES